MVKAQLEVHSYCRYYKLADKLNEKSRSSFKIPFEPNSQKVIRSYNECVDAINEAKDVLKKLNPHNIEEDLADYFLILPIQNQNIALELFDLIEIGNYEEAMKRLLVYPYFEIFYIVKTETESKPYAIFTNKQSRPRYASEIFDNAPAIVFDSITKYSFSNDFDAYLKHLKELTKAWRTP